MMIKQMVKEFAGDVIKPRAIEIDKKATFPEDIFQQMGELGLMGIPFPEKYGGSGGDTLSYALAVEQIAQVCGSTALSYAANVSLGASPLYYFGTEAQDRKSTRLNSSHVAISYAVFCLKQKNNQPKHTEITFASV